MNGYPRAVRRWFTSPWRVWCCVGSQQL